MKLWIDDIRTAPDHTWMTAKTATSAIAAIGQFGKQFKEISLDHDISHQVTIGDISRPYPCDETFKAVAWFIAAYYTLNPEQAPKITIHSANPVGADSMRSVIQKQLPGVSIKISPMGAANRLELEV